MLQAGVGKSWGEKKTKAEVSIFSCRVQTHRAAEEINHLPWKMDGRVFSLSRRFMGRGGGDRGGVC